MGTILQVPYKSQVSRTAGYSHNDCGPACIAMMLAATGQDFTVDALYNHPSIAGQKGGISFSSLQTLSKAYGLHLGFKRMDTPTLKQNLDGGKPVFVLVDYKPIVDNSLNGIATKGLFGHFVVVVGYEDDAIVVHDPYWKEDRGAYRRWPNAVYEKAWRGGRGSWGNNYNGQSLVPDYAIAESQAPAFQYDEGLKRRIRAKALFEKVSPPLITSQYELDSAVVWLGDWGLYAEGYYIKSGDTLGKIAQVRFGSADFATGLAAYNGITDPDQLAVGMKILIPVSALQTAGMPQPMAAPSTPAPTAPTTVPTPEVRRGTFTNQQVINAFYQTYKRLGGDSDDYWQALVDAGLEWIANQRSMLYTGPDIRSLSNVPRDVLEQIARMLGV